jgi:hypothetical protein
MTHEMRTTLAPKNTPPAGMSLPRPVLQRKCACGGTPGASGECESCRKKRLGIARQAVSAGQVPAVAPPIVHQVLRSPGQPLDGAMRAFFEPRLGSVPGASAMTADFPAAAGLPISQPGDRMEQEADRAADRVLSGGGQAAGAGCDLGRVRIHTDRQAAESAREVGALAYTVGPHVVFAPGQYRPDSTDGRRLLAHELAHTVQQGGGLLRKVSPDLPQIQVALKKKTIAESDSHLALGILKGLTDEDLRDTMAEMEKNGLVDPFFEHLSEDDQRNNYDALRRIKNARVWTTTRKNGDTTVTTEVRGSCSPEQFQNISRAASTGAAWLDTAITQLDAYIASPKDAKNADVEAALKKHFHTTSADVARHVRERLAHIRTDIRNTPQMEIECHGTWDKTCDTADAYVPGWDLNLIVFCYTFHQQSETTQAETVVHEMAHAQVGGKHITDRAYDTDRLLPLLTAEEALTNAESYGLFTYELGTGKNWTTRAPKDTREDCSDAWWTLLQKSIAVAQRWNRNAQVTFSDLTLKGLQGWSKQLQGYVGGTTQGDLDRARKAYNRMAGKLASKIDFECEESGGGRCDDGAATYWYATGDFHICPAWASQKNESDRVQSLLAGLYGYVGDVDDSAQRVKYAKLAREINGSWPAPGNRSDILGSPQNWSPDEISIDVTPREPKAAKYTYYESGKYHERISQDMPVAKVSSPANNGGKDNFRVGINYLVDSGGMNRPLPFSPPQLSGKFKYVAPTAGFERKFEDNRPVYQGDGQNLVTKFPQEQSLKLTENGSLEMRFELKDPDSSITRVHDDTLQVTVV